MNIMEKKICVIGGGNIGAYTAIYLKKHGFKVNLYVHDIAKVNKVITVYNDDENDFYSAEIDLITNNLKEALECVTCIFITYPAFLFSSLAEQLEPFVTSEMTLCFLPGTGGVEFIFKNCIDKGANIFGLQRVPVVARYKNFGSLVSISGKKPYLYIGSINADNTTTYEFANFLMDLFETKCEVLKNYLSVTLTPSNPILHTSRLYTMFIDYKPGIYYPRNYLFYEEWSLESSDILIKCDNELQKLCSCIKDLDLSAVLSLPQYYNSKDKFMLTDKIKNIKAFKGIKTPMIETKDGWIPDLSSRYFIADFPYGLKVIIEIAKLFSIGTPAMDKLWNWFCSLPNVNKQHEPFKLQISKEDFLSIYTGTNC